MNYIMYGDGKIEERIYKSLRKEYNKDEVIHIKSDTSLTETLNIIKFKPFFSDKWFLTVDLDKISSEMIPTAISLLVNKKVHCYFKINMNKELYASIRKSRALNELEGLTILNARYPDTKYISKMILSRVNKYFDNAVIKYIVKNIRFNIDRLDEVIEQMNEIEFDYVSLTDIRKILPPSKTKSIRVYCYTLLLSGRSDLKSDWRTKPSVLVQNSNTKLKPYQTLDEANMDSDYLLKLIIKTLKDILKVKELYLGGILTDNNIFDNKDKLEAKVPFLKSLTIPTIKEYITVSQEVAKNEIRFCLTEFLKLRERDEISMEDIYFTTFKVMKRHARFTLEEDVI